MVHTLITMEDHSEKFINKNIRWHIKNGNNERFGAQRLRQNNRRLGIMINELTYNSIKV